jgi:hypothetical protein
MKQPLILPVLYSSQGRTQSDQLLILEMTGVEFSAAAGGGGTEEWNGR